MSETIQSAAFPKVYLRMDGRRVTQTTGDGGGVVNCQYEHFAWEDFELEALGDEVYAIASVAFPGVYLRMDGRDVTQFSAPGAGTVNCQYGRFGWEEFRIVKPGEGAYAFESVAFPNVYLRMDGRDVTQFAGGGAGTVNCQYGMYGWEQYYLG